MRTTQRRWVRVLIEVRKKITIKKKTSTLYEVIYKNNVHKSHIILIKISIIFLCDPSWNNTLNLK